MEKKWRVTVAFSPSEENPVFSVELLIVAPHLYMAFIEAGIKVATVFPGYVVIGTHCDSIEG